MARDRHCRFPGCTEGRFVDAHHVWSWTNWGPTNLDNVALLCRFHHRLVHEGGFGICRDADGDLVFCRPGGQAIPGIAEAPARLRPRPQDTQPGAGQLHRRAHLQALSGEPMDRDLAVHAVLTTERLLKRE
jgi:hypothetical protein